MLFPREAGRGREGGRVGGVSYTSGFCRGSVKFSLIAVHAFSSLVHVVQCEQGGGGVEGGGKHINYLSVVPRVNNKGGSFDLTYY